MIKLHLLHDQYFHTCNCHWYVTGLDWLMLFRWDRFDRWVHSCAGLAPLCLTRLIVLYVGETGLVQSRMTINTSDIFYNISFSSLPEYVFKMLDIRDTVVILIIKYEKIHQTDSRIRKRWTKI